jgi:hypothetical protein
MGAIGDSRHRIGCYGFELGRLSCFDQEQPLNDYARFAIDILLVFIYMFFLISSKRPEFWLPILAVVFFL